MESLLPSEIARLVLGYLEGQKCEDAARLFLESSPHLQECRAVTSSGGRFSTKVNGFALVDILEKFCAANAIIHERLSKVADCEQLKHCGDLLEQLRFLVDGSRGQRFVVNINVPTTSQASGGSPIISSSMRKRHHSGSDRDRSKRSQKTSEKSTEPVTSHLSCDAVETTPLENLPGHSSSERAQKISEESQELAAKGNCSSTVPETIGAQKPGENFRASAAIVQSTPIPEDVRTDPLNNEKINERCSAATDTEELMHYTNTEVQTTPYDAAESETESTYEPVENLSLLTKELLNRTELQERIAENINKAILPSDTSLRDISLSESIGGEMNTSIMTELNNAIKSVVTATESDPIFAKFLDEIIGPDAENDESPDEDNDHHRPISADGLSCKPPDPVSDEKSDPRATPPFEKIASAKSQTPEVPLKNRLRSSSSQQSGTSECVTRDDTAALEDVNAAAILSIINANSKLEHESSNIDRTSEISELVNEKRDTEIKLEANDEAPLTSSLVKSVKIEKSIVQPSAINSSEIVKSKRKTNPRKPRIAKPKIKVPEIIPENLMSEEDIMAMPTLIVCSKEEISTMINSAPPLSETINSCGGYRASQFLPIAPKTSEILALPPPPKPIYLRTVTVPTKLSEIPKIAHQTFDNLDTFEAPKNWQEINSPADPNIPSFLVSTASDENLLESASIDVSSSTTRAITEKITLYGNENSAIALIDNSVVASLQNDETHVSISGTGLSPFLKFNNENPRETELAGTRSHEEAESLVAASSSIENREHITRRTPRSLLKSRSKNNRLSMSTPRRRSGHIRALDFNTPSKCAVKTTRRMSIDDSFEYSSNSTNFGRKICRASLFKSPPFDGAAAITARKIKSPPKDRGPCKLPIATRSPAPKLMGGWEKYNGIGMILGSSSPSSSSSSPIKIAAMPQKNPKSWDEDLRKSLLASDETATTTTTTATTTRAMKKIITKRTNQTSKRQRRKKTIESTISNLPSDDPSSDCDSVINFKEITKDTSNVASLISLETTKNLIVTESSTFPEITKESTIKLTVLSANNETIDDTKNAMKNNDAIVKSVKKKYAKLRTITTSVTMLEDNCEILRNPSSTSVDKIGESSCNDKAKIHELPDMLELETPRKFDDNFEIPPTPRLLSPGSNLTNPFVSIPDDSTKLASFVLTPEFPPTPSINLTPKHSCDNVTDEKSKEFQGCSSEYYEPSSRPKDPRIKRNDCTRHDMSLPLPGMMSITAETRINNTSGEIASGFQEITTTTTSNKLEISQFEVIKENLSREEAFRELKISNCTNETTRNVDETIPAVPAVINESSRSSACNDFHDTKDTKNACSTTIDDDDDDSSDSDDSTSSSDSSSTSSSSSSSCSSSATTNPSPNLITNRQSPKTTASRINDTSNDSRAKDVENDEKKVIEHSRAPNDQRDARSNDGSSRVSLTLLGPREENENSPKKVFSLMKNEDELANCDKETPAKDESLLSEAVISETPSSSKPGIETTNLHSRISALITSENCETRETSTKKALPKIVSVQRILPNVAITIKPTCSNADTFYNALQNRNQSCAISDAKLSRQLEEKRLRLMAKFKETKKAPIQRARIKRLVAVARSKRTKIDKDKSEATEERDKNSETMDRNVETMDKEENIDSEEGKKRKTMNEREETKRAGEELDSTESKPERELEAKMRILKDEDTEKVESKRRIDENEKITITTRNVIAEMEKVSDDMKKDRNEEKLAELNLNEESQRLKTRKSTDEENERAGTRKIIDRDTEKMAIEETRIKSPEEQTNEEILQFPVVAECFKEQIRGDDVNEEDSAKRGVTGKKHDKKRNDEPTLYEATKYGKSHSPMTAKLKSTGEVDKTTKIEENLDQESSNRNNTIVFPLADEITRASNEDMKKETKDCEDTIAMRTETKILAKSKVDLVKRDLFSDEESNDQRTTRSRSRQTTDFHGSDSVESRRVSTPSLSEKNNSLSCSPDDMPGVLECLDLVPTIKSDANDEDFAMLDSSQRRHHAEYHFIYDEGVSTTGTTGTKKRRRKFSNSELEFPVEVQLSDENYRKCPKLMKATIFEEIFNLTPPRRKRGTTIKDGKSTAKYIKKESTTIISKRCNTVFKGIQEKPLATSSPVCKTTSSKVASVKSNAAKSPKNIEHRTSNEGRNKRGNVRNETKQQQQQQPLEHEKRNPKTRKRKVSASKDSEQQQVEKKSRSKNPQLLLNKVDLDKFLTTVHGPA